MFTAINAPKNMKKCILEKTGRIGTKVLMSGGERCNVSNIDIEAERDYFGKNTKAMFAPLSKFSNYDMINWLESRGVETHIEDRGRIILHSGRATELVDILHQELKKIILKYTMIPLQKVLYVGKMGYLKYKLLLEVFSHKSS